MRRLCVLLLLVVVALGTLALAIPTPVVNACLHCVPIGNDCPPCTRLTQTSCFRCPSCQPIPGCKP